MINRLLNPLRTRFQYRFLLLLALTILIPTIAGAAFNIARTSAVLLDSARITQRRISDSQANGLVSALVSQKTSLLQLSNSSPIRTLATKTGDYADPIAKTAARAQLLAYLKRYPKTFAAMCVLDATGQERLCLDNQNGTFVDRPAEAMGNHKTADYFDNARKLTSVSVSISAVYISDFQANGTLIYAIAITNSMGEAVAVLSAAIYAQPLFDGLRVTNADLIGSASALPYLVNAQGTYLYAPDPALIGQHNDLSSADQDAIAQTAQGYLADAADRIRAYSVIDPGGKSAIRWTLIYETPIADIVSGVNTIQGTTLLLNLAILAGFGLVAYLLVRSSTLPLIRLASAAEQVGQGNYNVEIQANRRSDELGLLARGFQEMINRVKQTISDLEAARTESQERARLLEKGVSAANSLRGLQNMGDLARGIAAASKAAFGVSRVEVHLFDPTGEREPISAIAGDEPVDLKSALDWASAHRELCLTDSTLALPIQASNLLLGVIAFAKATPFSTQEQLVLSIFAQQLAAESQSVALYLAQVEVAEQLAEANLVKTQFLSNASHELRTPLNSIVGYADVLQIEVQSALQPDDGEPDEEEDEDEDDGAPHLTYARLSRIFSQPRSMPGAENGQPAPWTVDELKKLLVPIPYPVLSRQVAGIHKSAEDQCSLVDNLLDLNRIQTKRAELNPKDFSLADLIQDLVDETQPLTQKGPNQKLNYPVVIDPAVPDIVYGDKAKILRVLMNLVGNAFKFTDRGSVGLNVRLNPETPDRVEFIVTDTGIGIPAHALGLIFEPFRQVDGSNTRHYGGSGLGLAITRELVHLMGGEVTVESKLGQGSSFTVTLPLLAHSVKERVL